jgi:hypothetical protein
LTLATVWVAPTPAAPEPRPPSSDLSRRRRLLAAIGRRRGLREFLLIAVVYVMYDGSRFIVEGQQSTAFAHALGVLNLEQGLDMAWEQTLNAFVSAHAILAVPADYIYATLHYLVTPVVLVWMWRCHRDAYPRARTTLLVATVIGLIGFSMIPVAPPRMLPGFVDTMAQYSTHGWWGADASAPRGFGSYTNQFAAMPSLHVGWALWCGWQLIRHGQHRITRLAGLLYPTVITVVVIATGNHYFLDVVAGMGVVFVAMGAVGGVALLLPTRRPVQQRRVVDLRAVEASIPSQGGR